jgi:hypothetical protein
LIEPNPKHENAALLIVGTSREIEVFEDKRLVETLEKKIPILCINTSFHYFNHISCLFLNSRFRNMEIDGMADKRIDEIYTPFAWASHDRKVHHFRVNVNTERYSPEISCDLNKILPHGPTMLLDIVFPYCVFHKVRTIYILGAEYDFKDDVYKRHTHDSRYINRPIPTMDRSMEHRFAMQKLHVWKEFFSKNQIDCYALSQHSKTPFQKRSLWELLKT